ncbi:MAG: polysaccharide deacetylase family protein [Candidatus Hydrothermarchaeaceae archaeon]
MRRIVILLLTVGCLGSPQDVQIANWPQGYTSAVCITFDTELATGGQIKRVTSALGSKNATFFVVAGYFEDRQEDLELLRDYDVANMAWAQHRWENSDLNEEFQLEEMQMAHKWLEERGFNPAGFRAPFLKSNEDTIKALSSMDYTYDSSQYVGAMPYMIDGIVEIPLSMHFDPYWNEKSTGYSALPVYLAFEDTYKSGGLFTFYSHVATASENIEHLSSFLDYAATKPVWFASAGQVADWWISRNSLELVADGNRITVKNTGNRPVDGVTIKISPRRQIKGALHTWDDDKTTYAVLPRIDAGGEVLIS